MWKLITFPPDKGVFFLALFSCLFQYENRVRGDVSVYNYIRSDPAFVSDLDSRHEESSYTRFDMVSYEGTEFSPSGVYDFSFDSHLDGF